LFLDEIEDLSLEIQGKLLRLLETRQFRPVGGDSVETSDFKLITASNVPLRVLCKERRLRFDLYNRLNRVVITMPPLRKHKEEIPLLIEHHLESIGEKRRPDLAPMERIMRYHWPGNVRELFKELELLSVFASQGANSFSYREILTESALSDRSQEQQGLLVSQSGDSIQL
jgi:transcriptional regulator with PAS, ATPase and Fis domain